MKKKPHRWIYIYIVSIFIAFFAGQWWTFTDPNHQKTIVIKQEEKFQTNKTDSELIKNYDDSRLGKAKDYALSQPLKLNARIRENQKVVSLPENSLPEHPEFHQPDPAILSLPHSEIEASKEELAESLRRNNNLSEEEIEEHIKGAFPPLEPEKIDQIEPIDMTPERLSEELELSLLEAGASREDIDEMVKGFLIDIQAFEQSQASEIQLPNDNNIQQQ